MSLLSGALAGEGIGVKVVDINILLYDHVLSGVEIRRATEIIERELAGPVTDHSGRRLAELKEALRHAAAVADEIDQAKACLRQAEVAEDLVVLDHISSLIDRGLRIFSAAYPEHRLWRHAIEFTRPINSIADASMIADDLADSYLARFIQLVLTKEVRFLPQIVGISVNSPPQLASALLIVDIVRKVFNDALVVIGGSLLSSIVEEPGELRSLLREVDVVVRFEGEPALVDLCRFADGELDLSECRNTIFLEGDRVVAGPLAKPAMLDEAKYSFDHLPMELYMNPGPVLSLVPSRSCSYRCAFCAYNRSKPGGWMEADPVAFADTVSALSRQHSSSLVYFCCSMVSAGWAARFATKLLEHEVDLAWSTLARVDPNFTPDVCRTLRHSGCLVVELGVESLSPKVLRAMQKGTRVEDVYRVVRSFHAADIFPFLFILWGFPGETVKDWGLTLSRLRELLPNVLGIHFSYFQLYRGSPAFRNPSRYGIEIQSAPPDGLIGPVEASWPTLDSDSAKLDMLREFLASLPSEFVTIGIDDIYRVGVPIPVTHCNAYLHNLARRGGRPTEIIGPVSLPGSEKSSSPGRPAGKSPSAREAELTYYRLEF